MGWTSSTRRRSDDDRVLYREIVRLDTFVIHDDLYTVDALESVTQLNMLLKWNLADPICHGHTLFGRS